MHESQISTMYKCLFACLTTLRCLAHMPSSMEFQSFDRTQLQYKPRAPAGRRLDDESDSWSPMRIHVDTSSLQGQLQNQEALDYIEQDLLPAVSRWMSETLRVRPVQGNLRLQPHCNSRLQRTGQCAIVDPEQQCGPARIPQLHLQDIEVCQPTLLGLSCTTQKGGLGIAGADYILYVTASAEQCAPGVAAYASVCRQDTEDRPISGFLNVCQMSQRWDTDVALVVHEILHSIGFSSPMFPFFRNDDGSPRTPRDAYSGFPPVADGRYVASEQTIQEEQYQDGTLKHYVVLPRVVAAAQRHFGCSGLDRIPLEESGGDGSAFSHWDERVFHTEVMAATLTSVPVLSSITLALLEDSGWYKPVYSKTGDFTFGKGRGCGFVTEECVNDGNTKHPDTFCTDVTGAPNCSTGSFVPNSLQCSHDMLSKVGCDACRHSEPLPTKFQHFSDPSLGSSRAFMGFCPLLTPYSTAQGTSYCRDEDSSQWSSVRGESFGEASRCVMSTIASDGWQQSSLAGPSCRKIKCLSTGMQIGIGDQWAFCSSTDQGKQVSLSGWNGHIVCPSYATACRRSMDDNSVPCLFPSSIDRGRCICAPGYIGADCAVRDTLSNRDRYPYGLRYIRDEILLEVGVALPPNFNSAPTVLGNTSGLVFSVRPALPPGLNLTSDGAITGTPRLAANRTAYVIRAALASGDASTTIVEIKVTGGASTTTLENEEVVLPKSSPISSTTESTTGEMVLTPEASPSAVSFLAPTRSASARNNSASSRPSETNDTIPLLTVVLGGLAGVCALSIVLCSTVWCLCCTRNKQPVMTDSTEVANQAMTCTEHPVLLRTNSNGSRLGTGKVARVKSEVEAEAQTKSWSVEEGIKEFVRV